MQDVGRHMQGVEGLAGMSRTTAHCPAPSFLCHSAHGDRSCGSNRCEIGSITSFEYCVPRNSGD